MTKWARKDENNQIVEIIDYDPSGKFHEGVIWHEVPDNTEIPADNGITPENNIAAQEEAARVEAEMAAMLAPQEPPVIG